jgi:hypothetical protein
VYLNSRGVRLYGLVGASIASFLVFTPGFGVQYLAWILPFCLLLGWRTVVGLYAVSSAFLFITYTQWSGGLPWYFADLLRPGAGRSALVLYAASVCWLVLLLGLSSTIPAFQQAVRWASGESVSPLKQR